MRKRIGLMYLSKIPFLYYGYSFLRKKIIYAINRMTVAFVLSKDLFGFNMEIIVSSQTIDRVSSYLKKKLPCELHETLKIKKTEMMK